eukprot:SAG11_NODE_2857_length_2901_cov_2.674875_1_plen_157_part_00
MRSTPGVRSPLAAPRGDRCRHRRRCCNCSKPGKRFHAVPSYSSRLRPVGTTVAHHVARLWLTTWHTERQPRRGIVGLTWCSKESSKSSTSPATHALASPSTCRTDANRHCMHSTPSDTLGAPPAAAGAGRGVGGVSAAGGGVVRGPRAPRSRRGGR